jgi:hypothetical protein
MHLPQCWGIRLTTGTPTRSLSVGNFKGHFLQGVRLTSSEVGATTPELGLGHATVKAIVEAG